MRSSEIYLIGISQIPELLLWCDASFCGSSAFNGTVSFVFQGKTCILIPSFHACSCHFDMAAYRDIYCTSPQNDHGTAVVECSTELSSLFYLTCTVGCAPGLCAVVAAQQPASQNVPYLQCPATEVDDSNRQACYQLASQI